MTGAHLDDRTAVLDANPSFQSYCHNPSMAYKSSRIFRDVRHSAFPFGCGGAKKQRGILAALAMAVHRERSNPGLIFHSDRDVQYTATSFRDWPSWESARAWPARGILTTNFFSCFKWKLVHLQRYDSRRAAQADLFAYTTKIKKTAFRAPTWRAVPGCPSEGAS